VKYAIQIKSNSTSNDNLIEQTSTVKNNIWKKSGQAIGLLELPETNQKLDQDTLFSVPCMTTYNYIEGDCIAAERNNLCIQHQQYNFKDSILSEFYIVKHVLCHILSHD